MKSILYIAIIFCFVTHCLSEDKEKIYIAILQEILEASCATTIVDPNNLSRDLEACTRRIVDYFDPNVVLRADGIGTFAGPTIASEYVCVNGIQVLVPGTQFYSLVDIEYTVVPKNERAIYFSATFELAAKIPTNGWNPDTHFWTSGLPEPYEVSPSEKKVQFNLVGRGEFSPHDLIIDATFTLGNTHGLISLLQHELPKDPYYQPTAFCLTIQDACGDWATDPDHPENLDAFGYGNPDLGQMQFLQQCVGAIALSQMASGGSPVFEANSFTCRAYHVGMAFIRPDIHCSHAALYSTVCTGTEVYNCKQA
jgi:hypothetical protein